MSDRQCKSCGDTVQYLSTDNLCDGCVEEEAMTDSSHQELLAQAAEAAKQGGRRPWQVVPSDLEFTPTPPERLEAPQSTAAELIEALDKGLTDAAILRWENFSIEVPIARALIQILKDNLELKETVREYTEHLPDCEVTRAYKSGGGDPVCTCGLEGRLSLASLDRDRQEVDPNTYVFPWNSFGLRGWNIVGMNHYFVGGERHLYVAMTDRHVGAAVAATGPDEPEVFKRLEQDALARADETEKRDAAVGIVKAALAAEEEGRRG